jgi:hypothetical protein
MKMSKEHWGKPEALFRKPALLSFCPPTTNLARGRTRLFTMMEWQRPDPWHGLEGWHLSQLYRKISVPTTQ